MIGGVLGPVGFFLLAGKLTDLSLGAQSLYIAIAGAGLGLMLGPASTDAVNRAPSTSYSEVTSPPYVGQIDYHEQHRYAYELFGIDRRDELEIGRKSKGKGGRARDEYAKGIAESLRNVSRSLRPGAPVLVVANDRLGLYPAIFGEAGMRIERSFESPWRTGRSGTRGLTLRPCSWLVWGTRAARADRVGISAPFPLHSFASSFLVSRPSRPSLRDLPGPCVPAPRSQLSRQNCEIMGAKVRMRTDITAPTETKAMTDAKFFPASVTSWIGGPWPVASMLSKYIALTQSIPSISWNPTTPIIRTATIHDTA